MKFRIYDNEHRRYVTNEQRWSIKPDGRLYLDGIKAPEHYKIEYGLSKNAYGTEIYENDVVSMKSSGVDYGISPVKMLYDGQFVVWGPSYTYSPLSYADNFYVLGTIHDKEYANLNI